MIHMKRKKPATYIELIQLRGTANYLFSCDIGEFIFPSGIDIVYSKSNKPKHIFLGDELIATIRPHDGYVILSEFGFALLLKKLKSEKISCIKKILVRDDIVPHLKKYKTLFAKHIVDVSPNIRPQEEVIIINSKGEVLAVGRALLNGEEMVAFKRGVAVKVRVGKNKVKKLEEYSISEDD